MATKIFVNLPVKDLDRSVAFFTKLGYTFNPHFTNEDGTCMIVDDTIFVMLLVEKFFNGFTKKEINDTTKTTELIMALSAESRERVDRIVTTALEAGATTYEEPEDLGWMYRKSFQDLDGHHWEYFYMEETLNNQE